MRIVCFDLRYFRDLNDLNDLNDLRDLNDLKVLPQPLPPNRKTFLPSHFSFPIMNTFFKILICSICCSPLISSVATAHPSVSTAQVLARSEARPKVAFSFDHLAGNPKVQRTFVSGEMLAIAREQLLKNDRWEFKHVVDRLSSVLALHTTLCLSKTSV